MSHLLEAQPAHGYDLQICNPPLNSDKLPLLRQINDRPQAMWEIMANEQQAGEGWIEHLGEQTFAVFPTNQYVPEAGDGIHFMLTFNLGEEYAKPGNTPREAVVIAASHINSFLDLPDSVVCYNMYYGRRDLKAPSMSWRNWHIHCTTLREESLKPVDKGNSLLREPNDRLREMYFIQEFETLRRNDPQSLQTLQYAQVLTPEKEKRYRYNFNGVVAQMPYMQPEDLAQSMVDIDNLCKILHREILSVSVSNYDEVAKSNWRRPYVIRPDREVHMYLEDIDDKIERRFLTKSHSGIVRGLNPKREKDAIYPGPCYSLSIFKDDGSMVYVIDPHSFKRNGGLESLGVTVNRQNDIDMTVTNRSQRAYAALIR